MYADGNKLYCVPSLTPWFVEWAKSVGYEIVDSSLVPAPPKPVTLNRRQRRLAAKEKK